MHSTVNNAPRQRDKLLANANLLAVLTIGYNFIEGIVSMALGGTDETLALFGFGVDAFIEVISAVGVWHMLRRIHHNQVETKNAFEQRALRITGGAFYALTAGLVMAMRNLIQQHRPETTLWEGRCLAGIHVVHVAADSPRDQDR